MSRAPKKVPITLPRPPIRLVPPTTTAAIDSSSSSPVPVWGEPDEKRAMYKKPTMAAQPPLIIYTIVLTRATLIPARRAASSLPPIAKTYRPKRVRFKSTDAATMTTSIQTTGTGMLGRWNALVTPPRSAPIPVFSKSELWSATGRPCDRMNDAPSAISSIASVVMNGGKLSLTTGNALTQPAAQPTATATISVAAISGKPLKCTELAKSAATTPVNATSDPTDKSMPEVIMTNVWPMPSTQLYVI